ncbi:MAG TPA: CapA family protein [Cyclobacteriaceae bacterium]|nr:CapA family protein [Cyclobacteriaceae bacterium]
MKGLLTIGLTGDVMIGRTLDGIIEERGYDFPWGNVLSLMNGTDLNLINLETTLTYSVNEVHKTFNFKAAPDKVKSLLNANISIVNLANNHILDYGEEGLLETITTLASAGIKFIGAGNNISEALAPVIVDRDSIKLGVLGLTDNEPGWKATSRPGTNYLDISDKRERAVILNSIEELRKKCDVLIVSIHWGPNMQKEPPSGFITFAHDMINCGASVIHGHSAHIFQGIECFNNGIVLYDTGDFVDDYAVDPELRNDLSAFFILRVSTSGIVDLEFIPIAISGYQVNQAVGADRAWVIQHMMKLSSVFGTKVDEKCKIGVNASILQSGA